MEKNGGRVVTMSDVYHLLLNNIKNKKIDRQLGLELLKQISNNEQEKKDCVVITGVSGEFPNSDSIEELWSAIKGSYNAVGNLPKGREQDVQEYVNSTKLRFTKTLKGSYVNQIAEFDCDFFKIPPKEAALMNPVHRIFLSVAYQAIIDAGYTKDSIAHKKVGTYIGYCDYLHESYGNMIYQHASELLLADKVGSIPVMMLGRLNKFLKISGPSLLIDTACSSSLMSITLACKDLLDRKVNMALAGGVRINNLPLENDLMDLGISAEDGFSRTFDDTASGAGAGEGVGVIVLKRLSDALRDGDYIYATIKGFAVNNESDSIGLTAPSVEAQRDVIVEAWNNAEVSPEDIGYLELHGTGTKLGDGVEFEAVNQAFSKFTKKKGFCAVGSVKSNYGHLNEASGILGLIKVIMMLNSKCIPPTIHFEKPNSLMDIVDSAIYVNTKLSKWESDKKRLAGINSFGLSGTNCHIVLEEYDNSNLVKPKNTFQYHKKRCWYSDYVKKLDQTKFEYQWIECNEDGILDWKNADYITFSEEENSLFQSLKQMLDINTCYIGGSDEPTISSDNLIIDCTFDSVTNNLNNLQQLVCLFRNLLEKYPDRKFNIVVYTKAVFSIIGEDNYNYRNALYIGYIKGICKELSNSDCTIIDFEEGADIAASQSLALCKYEYVGIRNENVYTKQFAFATTKKDYTLKLKEHGVYVIVGGASGIGYECAKNLLKQDSTLHICILGRKDREAVAEKVQAYEGNMHYYKCNICDKEQLISVLEQIQSEYGTISGIVNSSGVCGDEYLVERDKDNLLKTEILEPKVEGMENLLEATKELSLDFFVTFSSVATIFPLAGQSDYIAANMYCENLCSHARKQGNNVRCLLWSTWRETGMAYTHNSAVDTIFKTLSIKEGMEFFDTFLFSENEQYLVGYLNDELGKNLLSVSKVDLSPEVISVFHIKNRAKIQNKNDKLRESSSFEGNNVILEGSIDGNYSDTQYEIAGIVNQFLGLETMSITESFFEMGVDSVTLLKIKNKISSQMNVELEIPDMLENSSIARLEQLLRTREPEEQLAFTTEKNQERQHDCKDVAIIGISYSLPNCNENELFEALARHEDFDNEISGVRKNDIDKYIKYMRVDEDKIEMLHGSFFERIDCFDYEYFHISPNEAKYTAPEHRMALENAFKTVEDAGYLQKIQGTNTAVFTSYSLNSRDSYGTMVMATSMEDMAYAELGNTTSVISGRISHYLDLKGPALNIDSACSSSMSSLVLATQGIRDKKYDYALVQGIKVDNLPFGAKNQSNIRIMSGDGKTRTLDRNASGFGSGEGIISVLLKDYEKAVEDKDNIYAVIQGASTNHNGYGINMSAPSMQQQYMLTLNTLKDAGLEKKDIDYVEMHGTATVIGDDVEYHALSKAFESNNKNVCPIGSVKTNFGHLSESAGLLSVLKVVLMMKYEKLLPSIGLVCPADNLNIIDSPFYVNTICKDWKKENKHALINSVGINGTNAQIVLRNQQKMKADYKQKQEYIFVLSAKKESVLLQFIKKFADFLKGSSVDCNELSYNLCNGKIHCNYRIAFTYHTVEEAFEILNEIVENGLSIAHKTYQYNEGKVDKEQEFLIEQDTPLSSVCDAYERGMEIDWSAIFTEQVQKISLPTYPFERLRSWLTIPEQESEEMDDSLFYELQWNEADSQEWMSKDATDVVRERLVIVLSNYSNEEILRELLIEKVDLYNNINIVTIGNNVESGITLGKIKYEAILDNEESLSTYFDSVKDSLSDIVYIAGNGLEDNVSTYDELKQVQKEGAFRLIEFTKALVNSVRGATTRLTVVTNSVLSINEEKAFFENSTIVGLALCIHHEYPNITCNIFDVDSIQFVTKNLGKLLGKTQYSLYAVRSEKVYVRTLHKPQTQNDSATYQYKKQGLYIITGGTGGIGFTVAKDLVSKKIQNVVLFASEHSDNKNLDELGKNVKIYRMDLADKAAVERALQDVRTNIGAINGIFHCAGRSDGKIILRKNEEDFENVISSKIYGSWLLHELTKEDNLDFIVCFSSEVTSNGEAGQASYVASNYFMNEFASSNWQSGRKVMSLSWTTWKEVGMGKRNNINFDMLLKVLDNKTGLYALNRGLAFQTSNLIIGQLNEEYLCEYADKMQYLSFKISDEIISTYDVETIQKGMAQDSAGYDSMGDLPEASRKKLVEGQKIQSVQLKGLDSYSKIEQDVGQCFAKVLGYEEIDVNTSFYELGGDSILLTRLQLLINELYPDALNLNDLFQYNSINKIATYLHECIGEVVEEKHVQEEKALEAKFAIVGYDFMLPCGDRDEDFERMLEGSSTMVKDISSVRKKLFLELAKESSMIDDTSEVKFQQMSYLDDISTFSPEFFGFTKEEAENMDPVKRLMMENIYKALEHGGYTKSMLKDYEISFFMGYSSFSEYSQALVMAGLASEEEVEQNRSSKICSDLAQMFGFHSSAMVVDTACSSSLVALHMACDRIKNTNQMAVITCGNIILNSILETGSTLGFASEDGFTRTFDDSSTGAGAGEGVVTIVVKNLSKALEDRDFVYGVIDSSIINQNGHSAGITVPNQNSQESLLEESWKQANINPEDISYIELHGTGTKIGDYIEFEALKNTFAKDTDRKNFCAVGGIKANLGHLYEGAGMAGLLKILAMFKNQCIYPMPNFMKPNNNLNLIDSALYVNEKLEEKQADEMICGISSFGLSGTNCHMILHKYQNSVSQHENLPKILKITGKTESAVRNIAREYLIALQSTEDFSNLLYTLNARRNDYAYKIILTFDTKEDLMKQLQRIDELNVNYIETIEQSSSGDLEDVINQYKQKQYEDKELEHIIIQRYLEGEAILWNKLYPDCMHAISAPTYQFDKTSCWKTRNL